MADAIEEALTPIRKSLQADGYELIVDRFDAGILSVVIEAGPQACAECLVPKELMQLMIEQTVKNLARSVQLRYPETSHSPH